MKFRLVPTLLAAVLSLNLLLPAVSAQFNFNDARSLRPWVELVVGNNQFPDSWLIFPNVVYYLILPFIAIVAVVYGIISDLRIFRHSRWTRSVISVAMAGMTLPSGALIQAVYNMYSFNAAFAAIAFGVVFFIGVFIWGIGTTTGSIFRTVNEVTVARAQGDETRALSGQIRVLQEQNVNAINGGNPADIAKNPERNRQIAVLQARIKQIEQSGN